MTVVFATIDTIKDNKDGENVFEFKPELELTPGYLTDWLQLKTTLSSEYKIFSKTGKPGFGDPSDNIKQGKIIKNREPADVTIPTDILQSANEGYIKCREALMKQCSII